MSVLSLPQMGKAVLGFKEAAEMGWEYMRFVARTAGAHGDG